MDMLHFGFLHFLTIKNNAINDANEHLHPSVYVNIYMFNSLGIQLRVELLGLVVNSVSLFEELPNWFPK